MELHATLRAGQVLRCPYCLDDVVTGNAGECQACRALYHEECALELGRCANQCPGRFQPTAELVHPLRVVLQAPGLVSRKGSLLLAGILFAVVELLLVLRPSPISLGSILRSIGSILRSIASFVWRCSPDADSILFLFAFVGLCFGVPLVLLVVSTRVRRAGPRTD